MLGSPTAGKRRSHNTLLGTRFRICNKTNVKRLIIYFTHTHTHRNSSSLIIRTVQTYIDPHLESRWINLVELVEVAVDNGVLWETILRTSCYNNRAWHLLPSCSFVTDLNMRNENIAALTLTFVLKSLLNEGTLTKILL